MGMNVGECVCGGGGLKVKTQTGTLKFHEKLWIKKKKDF